MARQGAKEVAVTQGVFAAGKVDNRAERFNTAAGAVNAIGKGVAEGLQKQVDTGFFRTDESREDVRTAIDSAQADINSRAGDEIGEIGGNASIDAVANGGNFDDVKPGDISLSKDRLLEIGDTVLRENFQTKQRLDEAVKRGILSSKDAQRIANRNIQRSGNTEIGAGLMGALRNLYAPHTGNPATSPAVTFEKTKEEKLEDARQKQEVELAVAEEANITQIKQETGKNDAEAKTYLGELRLAEGRKKEFDRKAQDQQITGAEALDNLADEFFTETAVLDQQLIEGAVSSVGVGLTPLQVRTNIASIRNSFSKIQKKYSKYGKSVVDKVNEEVERQVKIREDMVNNIANLDITADALKQMQNITAGEGYSAFPWIAALTAVNPDLASQIGQTSRTKASYLEAITQLTGNPETAKSVELMGNTIQTLWKMTMNQNGIAPPGSPPPSGLGPVAQGKQNYTPTDVDNIVTMAVTQTFDGEKGAKDSPSEVSTSVIANDPIMKQKYADKFNSTSDGSLTVFGGAENILTNLDTTSRESRNKINLYTEAVNSKGKAISRRISDTTGLDPESIKIVPRGNIEGNWGIEFPEGMEDDDLKTSLKQYSLFIKNTPSMWRGTGKTWQEVAQEGFRNGTQYSVDEVLSSMEAQKQVNSQKIAPTNPATGRISAAVGEAVDFMASIGPVALVRSIVDSVSDIGSSIAEASQDASRTPSSKVRKLPSPELTDPRGVPLTAMQKMEGLKSMLANGKLSSSDPEVRKAIQILGDEILNEQANGVPPADTSTPTPANAGTPPVSKAQEAISNLPPAQEGATLTGNQQPTTNLPAVEVSEGIQGENTAVFRTPNGVEIQRPAIQNAEREAIGFNPEAENVSVAESFKRALDTKTSTLLDDPVTVDDQTLDVDPNDVATSVRKITMAFEHPDNHVSKFTQSVDADGNVTVDSGNAMEGDEAKPYMFEVPGKGWEVDIGYGDLVKSGLSKEKAEALVKSTKPITKRDAKIRLVKHLQKDTKAIEKEFPKLSDAKVGVIAMMKYQGANILAKKKDGSLEWKNTVKKLKIAIANPTDANWKAVQDEMLDSTWRRQTKDRAEETVRKLHTP